MFNCARALHKSNEIHNSLALKLFARMVYTKHTHGLKKIISNYSPNKCFFSGRTTKEGGGGNPLNDLNHFNKRTFFHQRKNLRKKTITISSREGGIYDLSGSFIKKIKCVSSLIEEVRIPKTFVFSCIEAQTHYRAGQ